MFCEQVPVQGLLMLPNGRPVVAQPAYVLSLLMGT